MATKKIELNHEAGGSMERPGIRAESRVDKSSFGRIKIVGVGAFGLVYKVRKKDGEDVDTTYAMKRIKKKQSYDMTESVMRERDILCQVSNKPYVAQLHYAFQSRKHLYLVMEFAGGGDLRYKLKLLGVLSEEQARLCIAQLVVAVEGLHTTGYVHRDIKLENILVDSRGDIMLVDFGLSGALDSDMMTECGTLDYTAPEILDSRLWKDSGGYSRAADWWSVGVVTYELLTGNLPFTPDTCHAESCVQHCILCMEPQIPTHISISSSAETFIKAMLEKDPRRRLGGWDGNVSEVKRHPFFENTCWADVADKKSGTSFLPEECDKSLSYIDWLFYGIIRPNLVCGFSGICFQGNFSRFTFVAPRHL